MLLTLVTQLFLIVRSLYKCKMIDAALNYFTLEAFTKIIHNRDPVFIIRKLESHEVYQPFIAESM